MVTHYKIKPAEPLAIINLVIGAGNKITARKTDKQKFCGLSDNILMAFCCWQEKNTVFFIWILNIIYALASFAVKHINKFEKVVFPALLPPIIETGHFEVVEQVGINVTEFKPRDKVYGCIGGFVTYSGALTEFVTGTGHLFAKMPDKLSFGQAAALPLVGLTAYQAVLDKAVIRPRQKVLVYGGTGGVGHLIVQLAKLAGAEVYATVSDENKAAVVKSLGADFTINYRNETVEGMITRYTKGLGFDVVFDTVGNENLLNSFQLARIGGRIVTILALTSLDISLLHERALSLHAVYIITPLLYNDTSGKERFGSILSQLTEWVEQGKVTPLVDRTFSF